MKALLAVIALLSLGACEKKRDCLGEFLNCTSACDTFSKERIELGTTNGAVTGYMKNEKKAEGCKEECRHHRCP